jgi:hypothetical protein
MGCYTKVWFVMGIASKKLDWKRGGPMSLTRVSKLGLNTRTLHIYV